MSKVVVILSGGMDSTTLLYDVIHQGYDVHVLSFNYGQKHKIELEKAAATCTKLNLPHKIVDLKILGEIAPSALTRSDWKVPEGHYAAENMKQTVVPNRNMVMLSLATAYAIGVGAEKLFYGAHSGDHAIYPDCRKEFIDAMKEAILLCDWTKISLEAPYWNIDKGDIAIKGKELKVDYLLTHSCYNGKEKACGKCGACQERLEAFKKAGIPDPIEYEKE
jgi:7-cyano-7-deazaguanine synthase